MRKFWMYGAARFIWGMGPFFAAATAVALPQSLPVPGGVAVVPLSQTEASQKVMFEWVENSPETGSHRYRQRVLVDKTTTGQPVAVVGLPLELAAGGHKVLIFSEQSDQKLGEVAFEVKPKSYPTQHLTLKNKRMVEPSPEDLARWAEEKTLQDQAKARFQDTFWAADGWVLDWPVGGRISSPYGLRRFFNGQPRQPHKGVDVAAASGLPVKAPEAGVISLVGDYFFNGKTVFIDHGRGLISMVCHLSQIEVKTGVRVGAGQVVGRVGATGRATGPHLHWSVFLNGTSVDPNLFVR